MIKYIDRVPKSFFEIVGTCAGIFACIITAIQLYNEYMSPEPSSMSWTYLYGWIFVFAFWVFYGFRFRCVALWSTNLVAVILQILMTIVAHTK